MFFKGARISKLKMLYSSQNESLLKSNKRTSLSEDEWPEKTDEMKDFRKN